MAIRRTKQDKETASLRRSTQMTYSYASDVVSRSKRQVKQKDASDLLHIDMGLVVKDLIKTATASLVVFGILIALYFKF